MDDRDQNEHEVDTGADQPEKRPTVTIVNGAGRPIMIRQHGPAAHQMAPRLPTGDAGMTLQSGGNTGVDKEWAEEWFKDNAGMDMVLNGTISMHDEGPDPEADEEAKSEA